MQRKKLLVLSAAIGSGHRMAAEALVETAAASYPHLDVRHQEMLELAGPQARLLYIRAYNRLVERHPHLWGYLYQRTNQGAAPRKSRRMAQLLAGTARRRLLSMIRSERPDAIIATHFMAAELLLHGPRVTRPPLEMVVTDFDAHALWLHPGIARYHVASREVGAMLEAAGVPARRVAISGIPIRPAFSAPQDGCALREVYGLDRARPAVLVSCGGGGMASTEAIVRGLLRLERPLQVLAVAGRNEALARRLSALRPGGGASLRVFGFVNRMAELMATSDLLVAKCGGSTSSEALAMGLPMVVTQPIPGQETANSDHLLEAGAAVRADNPAALAFKVDALLADPERRRAMSSAAMRAARPGAAHDVLTPHARSGWAATRRVRALTRSTARSSTA